MLMDGSVGLLCQKIGRRLTMQRGLVSVSLHPPRNLRRGTRPFPTYPVEMGSFGHSIFWHHLCGIIKKILLCSGVLLLMDGSDGLLFQKIGRRLTMQRGLVSGSLHPPRIAAMGCLPAWSLDLCSAQYTPLAICSDGLPSSVEFGPLSGSLHPPCDLRRGTRLFPTYPAEEGSFGHSIFWHHLCGIIKKILLCSGVLLLMDGSDGLLFQKSGGGLPCSAD